MNATFHHDFLDGAEVRAQYHRLGFREKAEQRIQEGERLYGSRYRQQSTRELLREIREEGLDLGAWTALAAETLGERITDGDTLHNARMLLQEIAAHGVVVDQLVDALVELAG